MRLLFIDLSSLLHPIYHVSGREPDPDFTANATVSRVHSLATGFDHVAVCCDQGRSFRKDIAPEYKGNRPEKDAALVHQLKLARETLARDGFAVWGIDGAEADDVIATAVARAKALDPRPEVVIASSDKDLLQLVDEFVTAKSLSNGNLYDPIGVKEKLGVPPEQVLDWLVMVGDASDNIKGIPGIGPKRAAELLAKHGSLKEIYRKLEAGPTQLGVTPAMFSNLRDNLGLAEIGRHLVTLRTDLDIPFGDIFKPRVRMASETRPEITDGEFEEEPVDNEQENEVGTPGHDPDTGEVKNEYEQRPASNPPSAIETDAASVGVDVRAVAMATAAETVASKPQASMIVRPPSWELALEPQNAGAAFKMAQHIFHGRLFSNMPNEDAVFTVILMGRTLGVDALTMLRNVHVIEGRITLHAAFIVGLVMRSGKADFFKCTLSTNEKAVYKTHRKGDPDPDPTVFEYTIDDAKRQQLLLPVEQGKKPGNWHKIPKTMLRHRCSTELARAVYPDVVSGLYSPDEFDPEAEAGEAAA